LEQYIKIAEQLPQQAMFQTNDLLMREGKIPFNLECIGDMQQYLYKKSIWGEDAVYTGFPGAEGNGRIFIFVNCFAINSQSTHKEEAWKFVESYFTEEGKRLLPIGISQYCKMCWTNSLVIAESRNIIRHRMEKERNFLF
jgi:maltose-binding protein MalE